MQSSNLQSLSIGDLIVTASVAPHSAPTLCGTLASPTLLGAVLADTTPPFFQWTPPNATVVLVFSAIVQPAHPTVWPLELPTPRSSFQLPTDL